MLKQWDRKIGAVGTCLRERQERKEQCGRMGDYLVMPRSAAERRPDADEIGTNFPPPEVDLYLTIGPKGVIAHDADNAEEWIHADPFEWINFNR